MVFQKVHGGACADAAAAFLQEFLHVRDGMDTSCGLDLYVRPDRYTSKFDKVKSNAIPLVRGLLRFKTRPLLAKNVGTMTRVKGSLKLRNQGDLKIGSRTSFWGWPMPVS